ncbi:MAG: 50S ribosomal protein L11 methyltransferase [Verrucomicrobiales bacterium]
MKWRDAWEERFHGLGQTDAVIEELKSGKSIRIEVYCRTKRRAEDIQREFGGSIRKLKTWTLPKPAKLAPIAIRDALIVSAEPCGKGLEKLRADNPARKVISIPPEMAFGTGDHATTATCLRILVDVSRELAGAGEAWDQLDLGMGSGILAIAGRALGARRVHGYEYDARALKIARRNVRRHGFTRWIRCEEADVLDWVVPAGLGRAERYAVITANLFSDVLAATFPKIARVALPGAHVIVSGILAEDAERCLEAGRTAGIEFTRVLRRGKWVGARGVVGHRA